MEKYLEILKNCPLFTGIDEKDLLRMLTCLGAKIKFFDKNYAIFSEGMPTKHIGILLSGEIYTEQTDYYGNRSILSDIKPTQTFGESFSCAEVARLPVQIIANEPSEVMLIDCSHILHTCHNSCGFHQQLIYNLMKALAQNNVELHQRAEVTSKRSTREKLLTYLMQQSKKTGKHEFDIPFDRQELADYLEVERSGLSSEISKLSKEGILKTQKNHFVIL